MTPKSTDEDLLARQAALQDRAREVLAGLDIYAAVIDDGVRTLDEFAAWLAARGLGKPDDRGPA